MSSDHRPFLIFATAAAIVASSLLYLGEINSLRQKNQKLRCENDHLVRQSREVLVVGRLDKTIVIDSLTSNDKSGNRGVRMGLEL
jgi:hypothetical protein